MFPLIPALLLAVWLVQPWSAVDFSSPDRFTPSQETWVRYADAAEMSALKVRRVRVAAASATPAPTVAPSPIPAPPPPPTPQPTPAPTAIPIFSLAPQEIYSIVCSYAWPCEQALAVMWCESGGRPWVIGRGVNYGLFQINQIHARRIAAFWESWMDPAQNTAWAYDLWARQGWQPWGCKTALTR